MKSAANAKLLCWVSGSIILMMHFRETKHDAGTCIKWMAFYTIGWLDKKHNLHPFFCYHQPWPIWTYSFIPWPVAMQALLKMVSSYSTVALSPSRKDVLTESPLKIVLFALRKMCDHAACRLFLRSSELLPVIVHLRQSPDPAISEYASAIATKACQPWAFDIPGSSRPWRGHDHAAAMRIWNLCNVLEL